MKKFLVLGTGCSKCRKTTKLIKDVAKKRQMDVEIKKVEDLQQIMDYSVMRTPAVVVEGVVVHQGSVPKTKQIEEWLN